MKNTIVFGLFVLGIVISGCSESVSNPPKPTANRTLTRTTEGALTQRETQAITAQATVEKINYSSREVLLKRSDGSSLSVTASPSVKRLNEIKVGDRVVLQYFESLAFEVRKPTAGEQSNPRVAGSAVTRSDESVPPGMGAVTVTKTIVTVAAIDLANDTVTVKLPEGKDLTVKARYPENLRRITVGDTIAVTYAEALAVSIDPA